MPPVRLVFLEPAAYTLDISNFVHRPRARAQAQGSAHVLFHALGEGVGAYRHLGRWLGRDGATRNQPLPSLCNKVTPTIELLLRESGHERSCPL